MNEARGEGAVSSCSLTAHPALTSPLPPLTLIEVDFFERDRRMGTGQHQSQDVTHVDRIPREQPSGVQHV